jgi:LmbE family N-acetylglucosaminyl deacetylase
MTTATKPDTALTPALTRILQFVADGGERGRMELQVVASGGRAVSQLSALRRAGYIEYVAAPFVTHGHFEPDHIRITDAGKKALAAAASLSYRRDGDRYLVYLGDDRIGFVRYAPDRRRWNAVDTTMAYIRWFDTRAAAGKALHRRFTKMMQGGRL